MKNRKPLVSIMAGVLAAVMLLTLVIGLLPTTASAASSSEIRKQINALKKQREDIQKDIDNVKSQYKANEDEIADIVARKNIIDQEISLLHAEIYNINEQIATFNVMIADKQDELDHAQERFDELEEKNRARIRTMEEEGEISYWEVIFKANSFSDLLDRLNMVEEIAASDKRHLQEMADAAQNVSLAQAELASQKEELVRIQIEQDVTKAELDDKRKEADDLIAELVAKGYELEDLEKRYSQEKQDLLSDIAQKEKEYNEAKHAEWVAHMATATTAPPAPTAGGSAGSDGGSGDGGGGSGGSGGGGAPVVGTGWIIPCNYRKVTSPFGRRESPTAGASSYHQGIDLGAPAGTPIVASRGGVVTGASYRGGLGNCVTINHGDGYSSVYGHMTNYVVHAGQTVSQGDVIGYVGSTGISTGNHLHFGIAYNGAYQNPASYVAFY